MWKTFRLQCCSVLYSVYMYSQLICTQLSWLLVFLKDSTTFLSAFYIDKTEQEHKQVDFDFLINGEFLRLSLGEHLEEKGVSTETVVDIEYVEKFPSPKPVGSVLHDDWISTVRGHSGRWVSVLYLASIFGFLDLAASYVCMNVLSSCICVVMHLIISYRIHSYNILILMVIYAIWF